MINLGALTDMVTELALWLVISAKDVLELLLSGEELIKPLITSCLRLTMPFTPSDNIAGLFTDSLRVRGTERFPTV